MDVYFGIKLIGTAVAILLTLILFGAFMCTIVEKDELLKSKTLVGVVGFISMIAIIIGFAGVFCTLISFVWW